MSQSRPYIINNINTVITRRNKYIIIDWHQLIHYEIVPSVEPVCTLTNCEVCRLLLKILYYFELSTLLSLFLIMNNYLFSLLVKYFKFTRSLRFVMMIVVWKFNISCELCALIIFIYYLSVINLIRECAFTRSN